MSDLDETNLRIIAALVQDPRLPNSRLAEIASISAPTLYARLRALEEDRVCEVRAQIDFAFAGYNHLVYVDFFTSGRAVGEIADDLSAILECNGVMIFIEDPRIVATLLVKDEHHWAELNRTVVASIAGINRLQVHWVTNLIKYGADYGEIGMDRHEPLPFINETEAYDAVDSEIIETLRKQPRLSNREVGRRMQISESNVRKRLARLLDVGAMKFTLVRAPAKFGVGMWSYARLCVCPAATTRLLDFLLQAQTVHSIAEVTGRTAVHCFAFFQDNQQFSDFIDELSAAMEYNIIVEARSMVRSNKHNCDYVQVIL